MARLTYGFLGAAAVALVSGFFVKHSSFPLLISIALSVAVSALILYGNARRRREDEFGESQDAPVEELAPEEVEAVKRKAARSKPEPDETLTLEPLDDEEFAPPRKQTVRKSKPKPKPVAPKRKPSKATPKAKPKPVAKPKPRARRVAVVPGAERYHKPSCRFAQSPEIRMVSEAIAKQRGYVPCGVCKP